MNAHGIYITPSYAHKHNALKFMFPIESTLKQMLLLFILWAGLYYYVHEGCSKGTNYYNLKWN